MNLLTLLIMLSMKNINNNNNKIVIKRKYFCIVVCRDDLLLSFMNWTGKKCPLSLEANIVKSHYF